MGKYILKRLGLMVVTAFIIMTILFMMIRLMPVDTPVPPDMPVDEVPRFPVRYMRGNMQGHLARPGHLQADGPAPFAQDDRLILRHDIHLISVIFRHGLRMNYKRRIDTQNINRVTTPVNHIQRTR